MRPYNRRKRVSWRRRRSGFFGRIYDYVHPFGCEFYKFWFYNRPPRNTTLKITVTLLFVVSLILPLFYMLFVPLVTLAAFQHILMGLEPTIPPASSASSSAAFNTSFGWLPCSSNSTAEIGRCVLPFSPEAMGLPPEKDFISAVAAILLANIPRDLSRKLAAKIRHLWERFYVSVSLLIVTQEYVSALRRMAGITVEFVEDDTDSF